MYYKLTHGVENELLSRPETGMGYQFVEAKVAGDYSFRKYIVLNSQIAVAIDDKYRENISEIFQGDFARKKKLAPLLNLTSFTVLDKRGIKNFVSEGGQGQGGAIDNPSESANGKEIFVRVSAYENDLRVDMQNKCLRPGSFSTTFEDYWLCKNNSLDPVDRYALPNEERIKWKFQVQPREGDVLQRGIVQPANDKRGGGAEAYFENGTSGITVDGPSVY
jgi:hypothetical protein